MAKIKIEHGDVTSSRPVIVDTYDAQGHIVATTRIASAGHSVELALPGNFSIRELTPIEEAAIAARDQRERERIAVENRELADRQAAAAQEEIDRMAARAEGVDGPFARPVAGDPLSPAEEQALGEREKGLQLSGESLTGGSPQAPKQTPIDPVTGAKAVAHNEPARPIESAQQIDEGITQSRNVDPAAQRFDPITGMPVALPHTKEPA